MSSEGTETVRAWVGGWGQLKMPSHAYEVDIKLEKVMQESPNVKARRGDISGSPEANGYNRWRSCYPEPCPSCPALVSLLPIHAAPEHPSLVSILGMLQQSACSAQESTVHLLSTVHSDFALFSVNLYKFYFSQSLQTLHIILPSQPLALSLISEVISSSYFHTF